MSRVLSSARRDVPQRQRGAVGLRDDVTETQVVAAAKRHVARVVAQFAVATVEELLP